MALPQFLVPLRDRWIVFGAEGKRQGAGTLIPPDGGIDFRVRASVDTRFHLLREPSLAMIPA